MKKFIYLILFLTFFVQNNALLAEINNEYKKETIEICLSSGKTLNTVNFKDNIDCISGELNIFSQNSVNLAIDFSKKLKYAYKTQNFKLLADILTYPLFIHGYKGEKLIIINSKEEFFKTDKKSC